MSKILDKYTIKTGKFGCYFYNKHQGIDMPLKEVLRKLNEAEPYINDNMIIPLRLQNCIDVVELRDKLNEFIGIDNAIGISVKWLDLQDILLEIDRET